MKKVVGGVVLSGVVVGGGLWAVLGPDGASEAQAASPAAFKVWAAAAHTAVTREGGTAGFNSGHGNAVSGAHRLALRNGGHATIRIRDLDQSPEKATMVEGRTYSLTFACAGSGKFTVHAVGAKALRRDMYCMPTKKIETVSLSHLEGSHTGGHRWDGRMDLTITTHGVQGVLSWHAAQMFTPS
ncbi:hypothetical protein ABZS88_32710 [Streptomyces sp. NPDC005480]|uniref:hypothetical protein n=1 Tax=Streptomyces sp. NPDC005480 TaxID=3154880 RepID=UPI0033ACB82C